MAVRRINTHPLIPLVYSNVLCITPTKSSYLAYEVLPGVRDGASILPLVLESWADGTVVVLFYHITLGAASVEQRTWGGWV